MPGNDQERCVLTSLVHKVAVNEKQKVLVEDLELVMRPPVHFSKPQLLFFSLQLTKEVNRLNK